MGVYQFLSLLSLHQKWVFREAGEAQASASPACTARPRPHPWRCIRFLKKVSTTYINVKSLIYEVACMCKSRNLEDPKPTRHRRKGDELHLTTNTPPKSAVLESKLNTDIESHDFYGLNLTSS